MKYQSIDQQIKTQISQQSSIDMMSKLEASFLEKFFAYNLNDYFQTYLSNVGESILPQRATNFEKNFTKNLYLTKRDFIMEEIEAKINLFYQDQYSALQKRDLPFAFKFKYCNWEPMPNIIQQGQLLFVQVKIKAQVQVLQEFPLKILKILKSLEEKKVDTKNLSRLISKTNKQYFNVFIIYFGDSNFHYYNKSNYQTKSITIFGKTYKLRIFVFYISKFTMVEKFKSLNKMKNFDYINDLMIQFYELKRLKMKKKKKKQLLKSEKTRRKQKSKQIYKAVGIISLVAVGVFIVKIII